MSSIGDTRSERVEELQVEICLNKTWKSLTFRITTLHKVETVDVSLKNRKGIFTKKAHFLLGSPSTALVDKPVRFAFCLAQKALVLCFGTAIYLGFNKFRFKIISNPLMNFIH